MVSFNIRDRSSTIPCFDDGFPPSDSDGRITRRVSKPVWIPLDISCEEKVTDLEVKMTFDLDENSDVSVHHSKGAFFVTHLDQPIRDPTNVGEFEHKIDNHDARISINDWEFGSYPRLNLKFPKGDGCKNLSLLVGFIGAVSTRKNAKNLISANIEYRLIKQNQAYFSSDFQTGLTMSYEFKHNNSPRSADVFAEIWNKHNVFRTEGDGNSIHPKQAITKLEIANVSTNKIVIWALIPSISGPGAIPYGIIAVTTKAQVGAPGTPSERVGSAAPASFAF